MAKKKYFELSVNNESSSEGITTFMNAAMNAKRVKLDFSLLKHLSIADLSIRHEFLAQIKRHYDLYYEESLMNKTNSTFD